MGNALMSLGIKSRHLIKVMSKNLKLYYSIREVSAMVGVPEATLRFWEKEIPDLNPQKTDTGVRQYRDADIELVRLIHHLVKVQGLTIKAARTRLKTSKAQVVDRQKLTARLENVLSELKIMQAKLDELCGKSL